MIRADMDLDRYETASSIRWKKASPMSRRTMIDACKLTMSRGRAMAISLGTSCQ
jgi:hypothetical protein